MASTLSSGMRKMNRILSGTFTAAGGHNFATGTITFINIKKGAAISLTNPTTGSGTTITNLSVKSNDTVIKNGTGAGTGTVINPNDNATIAISITVSRDNNYPSGSVDYSIK